MFLSAAIPAPGISPVFQQLSSEYAPQKALQMILRKALDDYEGLLASGSFRNFPDRYEIDDAVESKMIQTSRMMHEPILAIARAHFDPLGLESTRAFGFKLATAALAAFFLGGPGEKSEGPMPGCQAMPAGREPDRPERFAHDHQ